MTLVNIVNSPEGMPRSFFTYRIPATSLYRSIVRYPGVTITKPPKRFTFSTEDYYVEFRLHGNEFKIEQVWADTHVCPKDDTSVYPDVAELARHVDDTALPSIIGWIYAKFGLSRK